MDGMTAVQSVSLWAAFDDAWYRDTYPIADELIAAGKCKAPADAYAALAKSLVQSPNPYFSESWYLQQYKEVREAVESGIFRSGFDHFCRHGYSDLMPHWLFDPTYYRDQFRKTNARDMDPQVDGDPYDHFLRIGQHQCLTGHWLFDPTVYAATAEFDVAVRIDKYGPFTTFLLHIGTGTPEPSVSNLFDPDWYKARYPSVEDQVRDRTWSCALHHYLANSDPTAFDPSPRFSERVYLASWPDVAAAVKNGGFRNGFAHFMLHGRKEQRFFASDYADEPRSSASPAIITRVTARFPLTTRSFDHVTLLPCQSAPDSPADYIFGVLGPDREILPAFNHPWIEMRSSDALSEHRDGSFIYGGVLSSHFGHMLRDGLANLWFIRQRPDLPVLWHWFELPVSHSAWPTWLDEIWHILGLDKHVHHFVKSPITVDQIILPEPGLMAPNVLHKTQARALCALKPTMPWVGNKVWLSRTGLPAQFGRIEGEEEVEALLTARGWTILHPESLPVADQVNVFATAAIVAGTLGSAFHAVLLSAAPRAKLILVDRPGIEHTYYDAVAQVLELEQHYLSGDLDPFTESHPWATFKLTNPRELADAVCTLAEVISV